MVILVYSCTCLSFYLKKTKKGFMDVISSFFKSRIVECCPNVIGTMIKATIHRWHSLLEVKGIASEINLDN